MKEFVNELIMCPKCVAEGSVRWVRKFNAREDRALMNHFIDETHEKYICEKCKYEKKFSFQIVYLGATQEVNVNYIPEDELDELWTPSN